ncbi:MAG: ABC transporter permease subunit [Thermoanaerobaculia bacterium]|nr:ABC transporter permease subunit [Thermoanaerobaculia bacterium]
MRRAVDRLFRLGAALCAVGSIAALAVIVTAIARRGAPALGWRLLAPSGDPESVLYQLLGTLILIATALAVALPAATALALLQTVYLAGARARRRLALCLYALNGVPSILFGIFGLIVFVKLLGWGKSWLAGGLLLAMMIVPTLTVAIAERIDALPRKYLAAAAGLGLPRGRVVWSVILPHSVVGMISGSLLGLGRAAGETAPILFTAAVFSGVRLPDGIRESPVLALPYHIFVLAQDSFDPAAGSRLWGAAAVLLLLTLAASLLALPGRLAAREEARHG